MAGAKRLMGLAACVLLLLLLPAGDAEAAAAACPPGSFPSPTNNQQCVSCSGGHRCCTVNWTKDCPKCPATAKPQDDSDYTYFRSVFALQSVDPPSCRASPHAICTPKIEIGITSTCKIYLSSISYDRQTSFRGRRIDRTVPFCPWSAEAPVSGAALGPQVDLAKLSFTTRSIRVPNTSVLEAASITPLNPAPLIQFHLPNPNCTLTYRALTGDAAAFLLTPPQPGPPHTPNCPAARPPVAAACIPGAPCPTGPKRPSKPTCPPGHYLEADTDAKQPPCLPCPPGSYSAVASTATACQQCPSATYAPAFGSTACQNCPFGKTSKGGAVTCIPCSPAGNLDPKDPCTTCPVFTALVRDFCLSNEYGTSCCAVGNCAGQAPCKHSSPDDILTISMDQFGAALQLASAGSPKACKGDPLLAKFQPDTRLILATSVTAPAALTMTVLTTKSAVYLGLLTSTTQATVGEGKDQYTLKSSPAAGTVTVRSQSRAGCSAAFKLTAGYVFDLQPPKEATCPPGTKTVTAGGRSFCLAP